MRTILSLIMAVFLSASGNCFAEHVKYIQNATLNMEDDSIMVSLPSNVTKILKPDYFKLVRNDAHCKEATFVGIQVDLDGDGEKSDWLAMSRGGCTMGLHSTYMWVVKKVKKSYEVVLGAEAHNISVLKASKKGMKSIVGEDSSAGFYVENYYDFNGKNYILNRSKSRYIDFSSPKDCKKKSNRDICDVYQANY